MTTMLVNFGDNRNGNGIEEPAEQPGSLAAATEEVTPEPAETPVPETKTVVKPEPAPEPKKTEVKEKVITGNNSKNTAAKKEESKKAEKKKPPVQVLQKILKNQAQPQPMQKPEMVTEKEMQPLET